MTKPTVLVIDTSYLFYRLIWSMPDLGDEDQLTHITFGFVKDILSLAKQFNTKHFVFCFDSKSSKRRELFPEYKIKRKDKAKERTPDEVKKFRDGFRQLNELRDAVLPNLGFKNIFKDEGFEADDIASDIVMNYDDCKFVAVSNDEDWWQLLSFCSMYEMKNKTLYTENDFVKEWGIQPYQWVDVKSWGGCKTDEVPGIDGVGPKTVCKYLLGQLKSTSKKYQDIVSEEGKKIYERNLPLVKLPLEGTKEFEIDFTEKFKLSDFVGLCEELEFYSLLNGNSIDTWSTIFVKGNNK